MLKFLYRKKGVKMMVPFFEETEVPEVVEPKGYQLEMYEKILFIIPIIAAVLGLIVAFMMIYHKNITFISKSRWKYIFFFIPALVLALITLFAVTHWNKTTVMLKVVVFLLPIIFFGVINWVTVRNKAAV